MVCQVDRYLVGTVGESLQRYMRIEISLLQVGWLMSPVLFHRVQPPAVALELVKDEQRFPEVR